MTRSMVQGETGEQLKKNLLSTMPLGRMGNPDEIAKAVSFLAFRHRYRTVRRWGSGTNLNYFLSDSYLYRVAGEPNNVHWGVEPKSFMSRILFNLMRKLYVFYYGIYLYCRSETNLDHKDEMVFILA
jgi:hypothetical protein